MSRTYSAEEKADAIALSASIGPVRAADQLGIPRRTVASWGHTPAAGPIIAAAEAGIAERLASAHDRALAVAMAKLDDPKTRLGDVAALIRTTGEQRALAEGRATAANLNLNVDADATFAPLTVGMTDQEKAELRAVLQAAIAEVKAGETVSVNMALNVLQALTPDQREELGRRLSEVGEYRPPEITLALREMSERT